MKIANKRDYRIRISGKHYFACDYVYSNVYGESVFFDEPEARPADAEPMISKEITEENLLDTLPETPLDALTSLPDCTKEIEYLTDGTVLSTRTDGTYIRYGTDENPMCLHILPNGDVTLSGDEEDLGELVFEDGKRSHIALLSSLFDDNVDPFEKDMHSPLHLGVSTNEIKSNMTAHGGSLTIRYTIDVNGILAEVTDFTLTADRLTTTDSASPDEPPAERTPL